MQKRTLLLAGFVVLKFVLQYQLVHPVYELHRDEYLHLDLGKHLSWGYLSLPPFTSWISYLILQFGNGEFWVRFFPALFGSLTMLTVWKAVEALKGGMFALILSAVAVLFSVLLRLNVLYQPNSMDVLCWVFLYFCLLKYISTQRTLWIWMGALAFAVGFLNKYNIVFAVIGLLPALLLTRQRDIFLKKQLYQAMLLAFILVAPNLWWQYQHGFPVFHHMQELTNTQLVNISRVNFLKDQLLFFIGAFFIIIAGIISLLLHEPFKKYQVLLFAILFTLCLFIFLRAKSYYAIGLYPILLAFGAVYLEHLLQHGWRRWLRPVAIAIPVLFFIPLVQVVFPVEPPAAIVENPDNYRKLGLLRWEDGKEHSLPQDFADMQGWLELAKIVDSAYASIPNKSQTLVRTDNYGQAGAINFYSRAKGLQALSYNADYIYWFPPNKKWVNMVMIKDFTDEDPARTKEKRYFDTVYLAGRITNEFAREAGTAVYIMLNAKPGLNEILQDEIKERQLRF